MTVTALHHVSLVVRDLDRSLAFYRDALGLVPIARPPFDFAGSWLAAGSSQVHLIVNPAGTFRTAGTIDTRDVHLALAVDDFEAMVARLARHGYAPDAAGGRAILVRRASRAGFPQIFAMDPDGHVVEINAPEGEAGRSA